ncbi:hypothetical protein LJR130_006963 [Variovorax sp. LjRoot130]|uniref:hypothetical protein n=1 Tax=Variovorax sp. LjRoot130 TaxID=3342261 RepID=UPI003ECE8F55
MSEAIGWLALLAGLGVLVNYDSGKRDGRFKTGFKDNIVPTQMPMGPRLGWTAGLWAIAAACLAGKSFVLPAASALVFVMAAFATWRLYPHFWSRYQRSGTSNAAFTAARMSMTLVVGGIAMYFTAEGLTHYADSTAVLDRRPAAASSTASTAPLQEAKVIESTSATPTASDAPAVSDLTELPQVSMLASEHSQVSSVRALSVDEGSPPGADDPLSIGVETGIQPRGEVAELPRGRLTTVSPVRGPAYASDESAGPATTSRFPSRTIERGVVVTRGEPVESSRSQQGYVDPMRVGPQSDGP